MTAERAQRAEVKLETGPGIPGLFSFWFFSATSARSAVNRIILPEE
ncbi:MAG TPA: hypothetical protein VF042_11575 [Gemmatimonadaceae bacterium]